MKNSERTQTLKKPVGLVTRSNSSGAATRGRDERRQLELQKKKCWETAYAPAKRLFMIGFMMWITGTNINIVNISITLYTMIDPIKSILTTPSTFSAYPELGMERVLPIIVYIFLHCISLGVGLYKSYNMGLLPTDADWAMNLFVPEPQQYALAS
eukprot:TRINITY_DN534_c0_g1_i1.p1 TRINITY_DN534_c0_g1~~TRINITY_DN534_c0_g1_i1.p1  ORF type:complete len:178 (-),score=18.75 TRINITY_DN534_c0_g1_i1:80-544(-)